VEGLYHPINETLGLAMNCGVINMDLDVDPPIVSYMYQVKSGGVSSIDSETHNIDQPLSELSIELIPCILGAG
jgi:hypothetical protein